MAVLYKIEQNTDRSFLINGVPYQKGQYEILCSDTSATDPAVTICRVGTETLKAIISQGALSTYRDDGEASFATFDAFRSYVEPFFFRSVSGGGGGGAVDSVAGSGGITPTTGQTGSVTLSGDGLLPRDGSRAMTGDLDLGSNNITNVNEINGVPLTNGGTGANYLADDGNYKPVSGGPTILSGTGNISQTQFNGNTIYRANIPVAGAVVGDIISGAVFSTALSNTINSSGNGVKMYSYVPTNGTVRVTWKIDFFVQVPANSTVSIKIIK